MRLFLLCSIIIVLTLGSACSQPVDPSRCDGGACESTATCDPNPCKGTFRTACSLRDAGVSCGCISGYVLKGNECVARPNSPCANAHSDGPGEDSYEPDECPSSATPLIRGDVAQWHSIAPEDDRDWFAVTVAANQKVEVEIRGAQGAVHIGAYDSAGQVVVPLTAASLAPKITISAAASQTFNVMVIGNGDTGGYEILANEVSVLPYDDFGNSMYDAGLLSPLQPPAHFLAEVDYPGDLDWIRFQTNAGHTYEVQIASASSTEALVNVVFADGGTQKTLYAGYAGINGERFVAVHDELMALVGYANSNAQPWYDVVVSDLGGDDHGDTRGTATAVAGPGTTGGVINYDGDVDFFVVPVTQGHVYQLTCAGACEIAVLSTNGTTLASSSFSYPLVVKAKASELWGVRLGGGFSSTVGSYSWTLADLGPDDHGDSPQAATGITVGTTATGVFEFSADADWFSFGGTANSIYRVTCTYCGVSVHLSDGGVLSNGSGYTADFVAPASDTYFIRALRNAQLNYSLAVALQGADDHGNTPAVATSVSGLGSTGHFDYASDVDAFRLTAPPGSIWRILIAGSTYQYAVVQSDGGLLASASAHPSLPAFKVPQDGVYYVLASNGFTNANYSFSVADGGQDDHGDAPDAATLLSPDASVVVTADYQGDVDALAAALIVDHVYGVECTGLTSGACDPALLDPAASAPFSFRTGNRTFFKAAATGPHHVLISSPNNYAATRSTLVFWDEGLDDHSNAVADATPLTVGAPASVQLNYPNDFDAFSFDTVANHIYSLDTSSVAANLQLTNYDSLGNAMPWTYLQSGTLFKADATGRRQFTLGNGYSYASFSLTVTEHGADDHGNTPTTASPHVIGGQSTGQFQYPGDVDAFSLQVNAGKHYYLNLTGCSACFMTVEDQNGVPTGWTSSSDQLGFRATSTATWTVLVKYSPPVSTPVPFTLQSAESVDDFGDTNATSTPVDYNVFQSGSLESPLDVDAFSMPLQQGATYVMTVTSSATLGLFVDDPYGNQVTVSTTGTNTFRFTPYQTKTWTLKLYSTPAGSTGGAYTFRVQ